LKGPAWNSTRDNIAPKPFLLFSSYDSYRPYIALQTVEVFCSDYL